MMNPSYARQCDRASEASVDAKFRSMLKEAMAPKVGMSVAEIERGLFDEGMELLRMIFELACQQIAAQKVREPVVGEDNIERHQSRLRSRMLLSIFGLISFERSCFSSRNTSQRAPADGWMNTPSHLYSHELERRAVLEVARGSFKSAGDALSRTTAAKMGVRQLEESAERSMQDFDTFYKSSELEVPPNRTSSLLILSADGKGIVMRKEALREMTRLRAEMNLKDDSHLEKNEKSNQKRMATVAAVYTIAPHTRRPEYHMRGERNAVERASKPPKPECKRVWADVVLPSNEVISQVYDEADIRDPNRTKEWVVLVDGAQAQKVQFKREAKKRGVKITLILDVVHVIEYLWKAARLFYDKASDEAAKWVSKNYRRVLRGESPRVVRSIRWLTTRNNLEGKKLETAGKCIRYLVNNREHMCYDAYVAKGFPIATGVIEGACRHLIGDRMDITGARWGLRSAQAVLKVRSLVASGDFDVYWDFHEEKERLRNHASRYKDGVQPKPVQSPRERRRHLRVVN